MVDRRWSLPAKLPKKLQFAFLLSVVLGVCGLGYKLIIAPSGPVDLEVFYYAAKQAAAGDSFIGTGAASDTPARNPYGYPPITVFLFYPFTLVSIETAHLLFVVGQIAITAITVQIISRIIRVHGGDVLPTDKVLIGALLLVPVAASTNLHIGQINHSLLLLFVAGYWMVVTNRSQLLAGVCFAVPALIKIWPAVLGVWLLKQRAYRAVAAAIGVGIGGIALSVLTFGVDLHSRYFYWLLTVRSRTDQYAGGSSPNNELLSIRRAISVAFPNVDPAVMALIGTVIIGIPVLYVLYASNENPIDTFSIVLIGFLLTFPSVEHYMLFPLFLIVLYGYTPKRTISQRWLAVATILVPLIILPRNIRDVAAIVMPPELVSLVNSVVLALFRIIHPATTGMVIMFIVIVYRVIDNQSEVGVALLRNERG